MSRDLSKMGQTAPILKSGGIGVMPTDTIYGIVAPALNKEAVERLYKTKVRQTDKPFIILISGKAGLKNFKIDLDEDLEKRIDEQWPGPVSLVLSCPGKEFEYLHRGGGSLAFRRPADCDLANLLDEVGPLVAPSANPEGQEPATTIEKAKEYFGETVDFYFDDGELAGKPSQVVDLRTKEKKIIRE